MKGVGDIGGAPVLSPRVDAGSDRREAARARQVEMWLRMIAAQPDDIRAALGRGDK